MELTEDRWNKQAYAETGLNRVMNRWWGNRNQNLFHEKQVDLLERITDWKDKTSIDLGCGVGRITKEIAGFGVYYVIGVDYSSAMLEHARVTCNGLYSVGFLQMDIKGDWGVLETAFYGTRAGTMPVDILYCGSVLVHILSDDTVREIYKKINGVCKTAIIVNEIGDVPDASSGYCAVRTKEFYDSCAKDAGFTAQDSYIIEFLGTRHYVQVLTAGRGAGTR